MFFKTILKINLQFCFECILLCPFWVMYVRDGWFGVVSGWGGGFRFWWPCKSVTVRSPLVHWTTENATTMRNGEGDDNCHGGGNIFAATVRMWVHDPWTGIKSPAWHVSALWAQTKQQPTPLAAWGATWFKGVENAITWGHRKMTRGPVIEGVLVARLPLLVLPLLPFYFRPAFLFFATSLLPTALQMQSALNMILKYDRGGYGLRLFLKGSTQCWTCYITVQTFKIIKCIYNTISFTVFQTTLFQSLKAYP